MLFFKKYYFALILLLFSKISIILCLEESSKIWIIFKGKSLRSKVEEEEDYTEPYQYNDQIGPIVHNYTSTKFIKEWFYNGMYHFTSIGSKQIESYINVRNSKMLIKKCNKNRVYSNYTMNVQSYYKPLSSDTYKEIDQNIGNEIFVFKTNFKDEVKIGEKKGEGLDFYFDKNDNDYALCGNFGLNLDISEKTNLIVQLKKKNYINKYIWTLRYQTEEDGLIILGTEPHFYDKENFKYENYCTMKAIPNQSPETVWSFEMDKVIIDHKNKSTEYTLTEKKVDFLIDRGIIIGTDEYKKKIDDIFFNDLIGKKICHIETETFEDEEQGAKDEYYVYWCSTSSFMGNKYTIEKTYYNTFPSLKLTLQQYNMTFALNKEDLFFDKYGKTFFLIIFKKSSSQNNIWKLGESFFAKYQFTFDLDKKTVGFYNKNFKSEDAKEQPKNSSGMTTLYVIILVIIVTVLVVVAYYFGKKFNESRKRRANELNDDDFEYSSGKKLNSNNAPQVSDGSLGL